MGERADPVLSNKLSAFENDSGGEGFSSHAEYVSLNFFEGTSLSEVSLNRTSASTKNGSIRKKLTNVPRQDFILYSFFP